MKFGENLQKLRKEKGISQEQLAEQLGVTRQSVSKWESGSSYPEMDKLVTICQIFNCDLDSLINKDISQEKNKQEATSVVKTVLTETTTYIRKTIQLLEQKSMKDLIKIVAQVLIIIFIICLLRIPFYLIEDTISNIFYARNNVVSDFFMRFWHFIFSAGYGILAIATFLYIFKIKFLDNETIQEGSKEEAIKEEEELAEKKETTPKAKVVKPIRNTSSSHISLLDILVKIITVCLKGCFLLVLLPLIFGTISSIICLVLGIILIFKGLFLVGPILAIIALIIFGIVMIELILNFVFNLKFSKRRIIITIITSIIIGAIGIALSIWYVLNLNIINNVPDIYKEKEKEAVYQMNDALLIHEAHYNISYIEDNTIGNAIKVKLSYYEDITNVDLLNEDNKIELVYKDSSNLDSKKIVDNFIENLKDKKIYTYNRLGSTKLTVTASKENIAKLQYNIKEHEKKVTESYYNDTEDYDNYEDSDY